MKTFGVMVAILALLVVAACKTDPGKPTKPGKAEHKTIRIADGDVLGKSNYGLWKASSNASAACRWHVSLDAGTVAHGGKYDAVISSPGIKGGVLHASHCGWFYK